MPDCNTAEIAPKFKSFTLDLQNLIAHMRFIQPEKANALTRDFWNEFPQALAGLDNQPDARVLVISAEGKHFSSGMDLSIFANNPSLNNSQARERERLRRLIVELQQTISKLEQLRFPTIAAIQGACIGGALDLICACDLRFATRQSYFCIQEINLAMMADLGVLQRLPKLIPQGVVRELSFTGNRLTAERALQLGFVNAIFDSEEDMMNEVLAAAQKIATKSPLAIAASKESLNFARDNSVEAGLSHAAILQSAIIDVGDLSLAAQAAAKKSEAEFKPIMAPAKL